MTQDDARPQILQQLTTSMIELDNDAVQKYTQMAVNAGVSPQRIIKEGLSVGMETVGNKFAKGEYFLSELIWAGQIMKDAMNLLEPLLMTKARESIGRIVIATVEGDLHDIGKNIAVSMLQSAGFEVIDLGVDVPAQQIIEKVEETQADIVALSALLSFVEPYVIQTVKAIRESSIGDKVKILLGGRIMEAVKAKQIGADAYATDAWDGVGKSQELVKLRS